eukprot:7552988-Alexandrium_andersonii.AAC.1
MLTETAQERKAPSSTAPLAKAEQPATKRRSAIWQTMPPMEGRELCWPWLRWKGQRPRGGGG